MENRAEHLLESYFANTLTTVEATELKTLVSADPAVAAEFAFQKQVAGTFQSRSLLKGIQNAEWRSAAQQPSAIKVTLWHRYAYATAAVMALLIAAFLFIPRPSLESVVTKNATTFPNNLPYKNLGPESKDYSPEAISALTLYDQEHFAEAAKGLEPIIAANPGRMDYRFYRGVSLIKEKQYPAAVAALLPVTQSQDDWKTPALYYLGLACAMTGDKDCAGQNLRAYMDAEEADPKIKKQAKKVLNAL